MTSGHVQPPSPSNLSTQEEDGNNHASLPRAPPKRLAGNMSRPADSAAAPSSSLGIFLSNTLGSMHPPLSTPAPGSATPTAARARKGIFSFSSARDAMPPVTRSKHAYPPRPVPLDQDWETVDASSIPADAASEGNTGNPKSHVAGTTTIPPATKLGERVDNGTEHADTTEQVELRALSQPAVEDESILLSAANLRAPSRKPSTPSLSQKPLTASTPRHAPSSTEKARSTAPSQSVSRVPSSARLSASSRSSIRDRLRAPAALLKAPVPKPPQSTRRPGRQSANRKTEAPAVEDTAIAAVIVGGHALRKRPISPERLVETTHMQSAAKAGTKPKTRRRRPVPRAATPANHPASATDAATTLPTRVSKRAKRV